MIVVSVASLSGCAVYKARRGYEKSIYDVQTAAVKKLADQPLQQQMMTGVLVDERRQAVTFKFAGGIQDFLQDVPARGEVRVKILPGIYQVTVRVIGGRVIARQNVVIDAIHNDVSWNGALVDFVTKVY